MRELIRSFSPATQPWLYTSQRPFGENRAFCTFSPFFHMSARPVSTSSSVVCPAATARDVSIDATGGNTTGGGVAVGAGVAEGGVSVAVGATLTAEGGASSLGSESTTTTVAMTKTSPTIGSGRTGRCDD